MNMRRLFLPLLMAVGMLTIAGPIAVAPASAANFCVKPGVIDGGSCACPAGLNPASSTKDGNTYLSCRVSNSVGQSSSGVPGSGGGAVVPPTKPGTPPVVVDPVGPTDPVDPVDPVDPTDPVDPPFVCPDDFCGSTADYGFGGTEDGDYRVKIDGTYYDVHVEDGSFTAHQSEDQTDPTDPEEPAGPVIDGPNQYILNLNGTVIEEYLALFANGQNGVFFPIIPGQNFPGGLGNITVYPNGVVKVTITEPLPNVDPVDPVDPPACTDQICGAFTDYGVDAPANGPFRLKYQGVYYDGVATDGTFTAHQSEDQSDPAEEPEEPAGPTCPAGSVCGNTADYGYGGAGAGSYPGQQIPGYNGTYDVTVNPDGTFVATPSAPAAGGDEPTDPVGPPNPNDGEPGTDDPLPTTPVTVTNPPGEGTPIGPGEEDHPASDDTPTDAPVTDAPSDTPAEAPADAPSEDTPA